MNFKYLLRSFQVKYEITLLTEIKGAILVLND